MSRSNPNLNAPHPAVRWFEWNGEAGTVRYFDKDAKKYVGVPLPFSYLLLDELAGVRGWHDASKSGIYSNEVRDTTKDVLLVKAFKGGMLAEGLYRGLKDRINALGGQFVSNCYIASKLNSNELSSIASMRFKGAALGAWMEFRKAHRGALYEKAIQITGYIEGKKGRIVFRAPTFDLKDVSADSNAQALALDRELQVWLDGDLKRKTRDQADASPDEVERDSYNGGGEADEPGSYGVCAPLTDEDIPF